MACSFSLYPSVSYSWASFLNRIIKICSRFFRYKLWIIADAPEEYPMTISKCCTKGNFCIQVALPCVIFMSHHSSSSWHCCHVLGDFCPCLLWCNANSMLEIASWEDYILWFSNRRVWSFCTSIMSGLLLTWWHKSKLFNYLKATSRGLRLVCHHSSYNLSLTWWLAIKIAPEEGQEAETEKLSQKICFPLCFMKSLPPTASLLQNASANLNYEGCHQQG